MEDTETLKNALLEQADREDAAFRALANAVESRKALKKYDKVNAYRFANASNTINKNKERLHDRQ